MAQVICFMSFACPDHRINWNASKELSPRINVNCFAEAGSKAYPDNNWYEHLDVEDLGQDSVPDMLYAVVLVHGIYFSEHDWKNHYGGSSWYVRKVFANRANALDYIKDKDRQWERYWVVSVRRYPRLLTRQE